MANKATNFTLPLLDWITIPTGQLIPEDEQMIEVTSFNISKYPITNDQFAAFIEDGGYKDTTWWAGLAITPKSPRKSDWTEADAPKLQVAWFEAVAFCRWLSAQSNSVIRLPTEWEWRWAAVGESGFEFPFGNTFEAKFCNVKESEVSRTNLVTDYAKSKTHFGTIDMAGNVWEWCANEGLNPQNIQLNGTENRVLKGGSWNNTLEHAKISHRIHRTPRSRTFNIGFRVVAEL